MKAFVFLIATSTLAAAPAELAFFEQRIRPVLVEHCYSCHSAEAKKLKGNLYLDSKAGWQTGGDSGAPAVIPGKPAESLLLRSIQHLEADLEMPPKKPKLAASILADFTTWIQTGAVDPREGKVEAKRADKSWWSLQPLRDLKSQISDFKSNPIDGFLEAKLHEKGLAFSPPADARTLIRRMTYDLHGLPPTVEEVEGFVSEIEGQTRGQSERETMRQGDGEKAASGAISWSPHLMVSLSSPQAEKAIEHLIERLLQSLRYGERWGRHWLDVVRFGESNGFERNFVIDDLFPFRDYVISSFNEDKAFDQFITEHLAGDVIGKDKPEIEVGSAFLVAGPYDDVGNADVVAQKNIRAATLDDMITATGSAFLGLTINCARCHHHKFDPIPTEDYYRVRAAFEGVKHGRRVVATQQQRELHAATMKPLNAALKKLEAERSLLDADFQKRALVAAKQMPFTRPKIDPFGTTETFAPVQAKWVRFIMHSFTSDYQDKGPKVGSSGKKLTEFQVWSQDERNVALASNGTKAEGAKSQQADDFPEAYGPQYCIDGQRGEAWFIGSPAELKLTFAKPETIQRITFINARGDRDTDESRVRGASPTEYEVQVSMDGVTWKTVATDAGREPWTSAHGIALAREKIITVAERTRLAALDADIAQMQQKIAQVPKLPLVWAGDFSEPKEKTYVHQGGDPTKPLAEVVAASLSVLDQTTQPYQLSATAPEGERRLALAKWITQNNPLTARVLANRVWQWHFGTGLVDTPSDFGYLGSKPTHPELLDYLATKLIANGWRLKELHREIMMSRAYRQASAVPAGLTKGLQADKSSRLLWRFPPRRLSAEEIRDTMLTVAGKMQLEPMGGPGFRLYKFTQNNVCTYFPLDAHGPETYRRAVYHQNARASVVDVLSDFDLPDIAFAAPKRANTTTPMQALTLLNHPFTLDMAKALTDRIQTGDAVTQAYRLAFQRDPTLKEHEAATQLITTHGPEAFCRALLNANELIYLE
jgi:Protein of unknown function (DUF1553)/Protein of unknown function (DUF1549)/Planctomycete cytochrome C/F5/8 type C domain